MARLMLAVVMTVLAMGARAEEQDVKVMAFNIWRGGDQVSFQATLDAILASGADVVVLQEAEGNTRKIAEALDWPFASERLAMISRLPLYEVPEEPAFAYIELTPGGFVAVANIHLPSDPYGPYLLRDGETLEAVLANEAETRLWAIEPFLTALGPVAASGTAAVMAGDFNSPSHLDWTAATVGARPHMTQAVAWPVSSAVEAAGFQDSFRVAHPDPLAVPGITWTMGYPVPALHEGETQDRIDFIHVKGARVLASEIVGEVGGPDVGIGIAPWPSDHRALVTTLAVTPGPAPALVSLENRRVLVGELLPVHFHAATPDGRLEEGRVLLVPSGGSSDQAVRFLPTNDTTDRLSVALFGTAGLAPGAYDAVLEDVSGAELARATFWLVSASEPVLVGRDKDAYAAGEPLQVTWSGAPGNRADWLGLYPAGEADPYNYLAYIYTDAAVSGSGTFDAAAIGGQLAPGDYEIRLLVDDGYAAIAVSQPFTVTAP